MFHTYEMLLHQKNTACQGIMGMSHPLKCRKDDLDPGEKTG